MSQARGPYEILVTDPGEEPSPPPSSAQRANDIARTIREYGNAAPIPIDDNWTYFEAYDESTAQLIADEAVQAAGPNGRIACLACPTVFLALNRHPDRHADHLFDYDPRFLRLGSNVTIIPMSHSAQFPVELHRAFSLIVADLSYAQDGDVEAVVEFAKSLSVAHQPFKFILLAPEEVALRVKAADWSLHMAALRPRSKSGGSLRIFTSITHTHHLK